MLTVMGSTGNRTLQSKAAPSFSSVHEPGTPAEHALLVEALSELHNLLEEYSPSWYTEEHHRKAEAALHPRNKQ